MRKAVFLWQISGFVFTSLVGTLLHFVYDWTGQSILLAPFAAVNESIWEHMKLLYFPVLAFSLIEYRYVGAHNRNFWCAKLGGMLAGLILTPMLYYTYTGAFDVYADWFNITIFFIAAAVTYVLNSHLLKYIKNCSYNKLCIIIVCLIGLAFIVFTFKTPQLPIFEDGLSGSYGVSIVQGRVVGELHPV